MPLWVCSLENSTRRRDERREELSARAPFFFVDGGVQTKLDCATHLAVSRYRNPFGAVDEA